MVKNEKGLDICRFTLVASCLLNDLLLKDNTSKASRRTSNTPSSPSSLKQNLETEVQETISRLIGYLRPAWRDQLPVRRKISKPEDDHTGVDVTPKKWTRQPWIIHHPSLFLLSYFQHYRIVCVSNTSLNLYLIPMFSYRNVACSNSHIISILVGSEMANAYIQWHGKNTEQAEVTALDKSINKACGIFPLASTYPW